MRNILKLITTAAISLCMPMTVFAFPSTVKEVKNMLMSSENIREDTNGISITVGSDQNSTMVLEEYFNNIFRDSDFEEVNVQISKTQNGYTFTFTDADLSTLIDHQKAVNAWAAMTAKSITANGDDRYSVLWKTFHYLASNYSYDKDVPYDELLRAQGTYYLIENKKGLCATFAKAFRALIEAVPFDSESNLVDWNTNNKTYMSVAILRNEVHEWTAVKDLDDVWYQYDPSGAASGKNRFDFIKDQKIVEQAWFCKPSGNLYGENYKDPVWFY